MLRFSTAFRVWWRTCVLHFRFCICCLNCEDWETWCLSVCYRFTLLLQCYPSAVFLLGSLQARDLDHGSGLTLAYPINVGFLLVRPTILISLSMAWIKRTVLWSESGQMRDFIRFLEDYATLVAFSRVYFLKREEWVMRVASLEIPISVHVAIE